MAGPGAERGAGVRRWLVLGGQLALTVLVTWLILERVGVQLDDLGGSVGAAWATWRPSWALLALSCLLLLGGFFVSGALWGRLVLDLGGPRVPGGTSIRIYMISNLGRYIPGKVWQIAGLSLLASEKGVPARVATGAAVLGQGIALAAATLVGVGALLGGGPAARRVGWAALVALAVLGGLALIPSVLRRVLDLWYRLARAERPDVPHGPLFVLKWLALYLMNWILYAVSFWVLVRGLGLPGDPLTVGAAFAAAYVLGYLAFFAPAGAGVREASLVGFLSPVAGAGNAAAVAIVARLWATGVEVVPAGAFWLRHLALRRGGEVGRAIDPSRASDLSRTIEPRRPADPTDPAAPGKGGA